MAETYYKDEIAKLRRMNELLRKALDRCEQLLREAERALGSEEVLRRLSNQQRDP
jgi:HPt (histidine-containing phosphotransfer) domain-containing protein